MSSWRTVRDQLDGRIGQCTYCLKKDETVEYAVCKKCEVHTGPPRTWTVELPGGEQGFVAFPHTIPELGRPKAPIPPPTQQVPVPEGRGWLLVQNVGQYLRHVRWPISTAGPPSYHLLKKQERYREYRHRTWYREWLGSITSAFFDVASPVLIPIWNFWHQAEDMLRDFKQFRRERAEYGRASIYVSKTIEDKTPLDFGNDENTYQFVIGFQDPGRCPNWRGKLVMAVRDPTRETSWLAPLDQDVPRWIWESYRLPDEWYEGSQPPSFKYRGGHFKCGIVGVESPRW